MLIVCINAKARLCLWPFIMHKKEVRMSEQKPTAVSTPPVDFSTTATIRDAIEAHADEPVIISVPIGGDASEFE